MSNIRAQLGAIPGGGDLFSLLRFLDPANKEEFSRHIKQLDERTQAHLDAVTVHGKAEDIERLHAEAKAWEQRAIDHFDERQAKLEGDEKAFKEAKIKDREAREALENAHREQHGEAMAKVKTREGVVKAREDAVQPRETNAADKERAARTMHDAGNTMKSHYENLVKQIQAVQAQKVA